MLYFYPVPSLSTTDQLRLTSHKILKIYVHMYVRMFLHIVKGNKQRASIRKKYCMQEEHK